MVELFLKICIASAIVGFLVWLVNYFFIEIEIVGWIGGGTCVLHLLGAVVLGFIFYGFTREQKEADARLREAFGNMEAEYSYNGVIDQKRVGEFLQFVENPDTFFDYQFVTVNVDFEKALAESDVREDDFSTVQDQLNTYTDEVARSLGLIFKHTKNITVIQTNASVFEDGRYSMPEKVKNMRTFSIEIGNFTDSNDENESKYLSVETEYGNMYLSSDFFFGKEFDLQSKHDLKISFGFDENMEILDIKLMTGKGDTYEISNAETSILITIPLDLEFMQKKGYNAVRRYVDSSNESFGILPRSYCDEENMYIFINRPGRFKLVNISEAGNENVASYLENRGLAIRPMETDNNYVSRAEFFRALMQIYWVEGLYFSTEDVEAFRDIYEDVDDEDLIKILLVGKKYGVLTGIPSNIPDIENKFEPNRALTRCEMFTMVARFIDAFGVVVNGKMPYDAFAIGSPSARSECWWYDNIRYLERINFVPYREIDGLKYVAGEEPVFLHECQDVLYAIITSTQVNWRK